MNELREEIELPESSPTDDDMEAGLDIAHNTSGCYVKTQGDCNFAARLAERERQLKSSLAANRDAENERDAAIRDLLITKEGADRAVEIGLELAKREAAANQRAEKAEAANREQKAEIERLKSQLEAMTIDRDLWQSDHNEDCPNAAMLASLRASVGEKWIEIKPDTVLTDQMEVGRWIRKDKWTITRLEGNPCEGWQYIAPNDFFTHYRMLAPPTLPVEEK